MTTVLLSTDPTVSCTTDEYASADDVQKLFATEIDDLFRLAFLLTADIENAQRCIILTMHESLSSDSILKARLSDWIRLDVIRNGIDIMKETQDESSDEMPWDELVSSITDLQPGLSSVFGELLGALQLSDFDRLVYVICVLERYPAHDCALLLGRSLPAVRKAQMQALAQVTAFERKRHTIVDRAPSAHSLLSFDDYRASNSACGGLLA